MHSGEMGSEDMGVRTSATADGVHDLHAVAGEQRSPLVLAAGNDLPVHLDGHPAPAEVQRAQELSNRRTLAERDPH